MENRLANLRLLSFVNQIRVLLSLYWKFSPNLSLRIGICTNYNLLDDALTCINVSAFLAKLFFKKNFFKWWNNVRIKTIIYNHIGLENTIVHETVCKLWKFWTENYFVYVRLFILWKLFRFWDPHSDFTLNILGIPRRPQSLPPTPPPKKKWRRNVPRTANQSKQSIMWCKMKYLFHELFKDGYMGHVIQFHQALLKLTIHIKYRSEW